MNYQLRSLLFVIVVLLSPLAAMAASDAPSPPSATQPTSATAKRLEQLKAGVDTFTLNLWYAGPVDKPFYTLVLHVAPMSLKKNDPFNHFVRLTAPEALKIIGHLDADGFLTRATDISNGVNAQREIPGPTYLLTISEQTGKARFILSEELGWNLPMLKRLDALRAAMEGDAASAMDTLLRRLSGFRKQWKDEARAKTPATQPG